MVGDEGMSPDKQRKRKLHRSKRGDASTTPSQRQAESLKNLIDRSGFEEKKILHRTGNVPHKLSAAILEIAQPILDIVNTSDEIRAVVMAAVAVWNISQLSEEEQDERIAEMMQAIGFDDSADPEIVNQFSLHIYIMLNRKLTLHGDDRRLVSDFDLYLDKGEVQFNVIGQYNE